MGRAIGLVLTLARASLLEKLSSEGTPTDGLRPVTDGLFVRPNAGFTEASIQWTGDPWALVAIECDPEDEWLAKIAEAVEISDMEQALTVAGKYLLEKPAFWGP